MKSLSVSRGNVMILLDGGKEGLKGCISGEGKLAKEDDEKEK